MSSWYWSSAVLFRELRPVSLLLSSSLNFSSIFKFSRLLGGSRGLMEEEEEDLLSGSGDTRECRSEEIPEEVEPVELDLE